MLFARLASTCALGSTRSTFTVCILAGRRGTEPRKMRPERILTEEAVAFVEHVPGQPWYPVAMVARPAGQSPAAHSKSTRADRLERLPFVGDRLPDPSAEVHPPRR